MDQFTLGRRNLISLKYRKRKEVEEWFQMRDVEPVYIW